MLSRIGILAIATLAACSTASAQVKVQIGDLAQSLNEIASRAMIDQGIDRKYGIAAEYRAYPTLDGLFTAIRGKDVDVGFGGWTAIAQFRSKGFPVTMVFPVGRGVTVDVVVPAASPIKSIAELKGKRSGRLQERPAPRPCYSVSLRRNSTASIRERRVICNSPAPDCSRPC